MMEPEEDPFDFSVYMDKVRLSPQYISFECFVLFLAQNGHAGSVDYPDQLPVGTRTAVFREAWGALCRRDRRGRPL